MTLDEANAYLAKENLQYGDEFKVLFKNTWASKWPTTTEEKPFKVLRNNKFLVQLFRLNHGIVRITVNRTQLESVGRWVDGITWDELSEIKSKIGYGHRDAIEFYPREDKIVNDANMRHLFVLSEALPFMWGL